MRDRRFVANLDCAAHTCIDPRVMTALVAAHELPGNPHNRTHKFGIEAHAALTRSREKVARSIGARLEQVIFTSGSTESNNLALLGFAQTSEKRRHIITCATEHKSVLLPLEHLEAQGWRVTRLPVDRYGRLSIQELEDAVTPETALVALMFVNNELGTQHDIEAIAAITKRHDIHFHCDATQAFGKTPFDVHRWGISSMSLSGHKIHGPSGIGALYLKEPHAHKALMFGGRQELGLRPGTTPCSLAIAFGEACTIAAEETATTAARLAELCGRLRTGFAEFGGARILGLPENDCFGILSVSFKGVAADDLLALVRNKVAAATGSACLAQEHGRSHVIAALGLDPASAGSIVRLSVSRLSHGWEINQAVEALSTASAWLRGTVEPIAPKCLTKEGLNDRRELLKSI